MHIALERYLASLLDGHKMLSLSSACMDPNKLLVDMLPDTNWQLFTLKVKAERHRREHGFLSHSQHELV
jgi:hypothetical protein